MEDMHFEQIGIVVRDLEKAIEFYEKLGVGPFTLKFESHDSEAYYYGEKTENHTKIAMGKAGNMVIELIEVVGGKSVHKDFLDKHGEGVDHFGFAVRDLEKVVEQCKADGFEIIEYVPVGKLGQPGRGLAYIDADKVGGIKFEFVQIPEGESMMW